jgi:hypothetical protein
MCYVEKIVDSSSGYTNATQCYVMCTLPVLLTGDIWKILQGYYKTYLISVQFTNILLEFITLQLAEWIYTLSLFMVTCVKKEGRTGSAIAVVSGEILTIILMWYDAWILQLRPWTFYTNTVLNIVCCQKWNWSSYHFQAVILESFHYLQDQCNGWDQAQDNGC